jgi:acetyl esterase/lipase
MSKLASQLTTFNRTQLRKLGTFVPNEADRTSPFASPLLASPELLRKLPPTYIDACSADPLYDGAVAYGKKLEESGVPVKLFVLDGMPHGSYILFPDLESSQAAHVHCMEGTKWALNASS